MPPRPRRHRSAAGRTASAVAGAPRPDAGAAWRFAPGASDSACPRAAASRPRAAPQPAAKQAKKRPLPAPAQHPLRRKARGARPRERPPEDPAAWPL